MEEEECVIHIIVKTDRDVVNNCTLTLDDLTSSSRGIYLLASFAGKHMEMLVDTDKSIIGMSIMQSLN